MCFSLQHSVAFTALGGVLTSWLLWNGARSKFVTLTAFFTLMEALQVLQYLVIDDCGSKINQLLTLLGWIHIAFQPYVLNMYAFGQPTPAMGSKLSSAGGQLTYKNLEVVVRRITLAGAAHLVLKALPSVFHLLGVTKPSLLYAYLSPRIADALVTNTCTGTEMLCGEKLCSMTGKVHLAWSLPMMGAGYYVTGMGLHFQMGWAAVMLFGGSYLRVMGAVIFAAGPLLTEWFMWPVGLEGRRLEWPATWCLYSISLVLMALVSEVLINGMTKGKWSIVAPDEPSNGRKTPAENGHMSPAKGVKVA